MFLHNKIFRLSFLFIFLFELFSLFGCLLPVFGQAAFFIIAIVFLFLSLYRLEYGLFVLLAELFIGSKGYLFSFSAGGLVISIRIVFWLIIMSVWLARNINFKKTIKNLKIQFRKNKLIFSLLSILFISIIWGSVNGFLNGHNFNNLFFDLNGWFYFLLIFPFLDCARQNKNFLFQSGQILIAAFFWLSLKTFFILFIFSHNISILTSPIYHWVRDSGVGEITRMQGGFYRIFFQSHIFVLAGFFIAFLFFLFDLFNKKQAEARRRKLWLYFSFASVFLGVNLISFSRSNWTGLLAGGVGIMAIIFYRYGFKKALIGFLFFLSIISASLFLIAVTVKFPFPSPSGGFSTTDLLSKRASQIKDEAGVSSRWNLLPKLWQAIEKSPVLGQGFGATVTYISNDPRVRANNPKGKYTTYAFEWGWLDIWLKLGIFGLLAYLTILVLLIKNGIKKFIGLNSRKQVFLLGFVLGLFALGIINIFSPYFNHPLGIGYFILSIIL